MSRGLLRVVRGIVPARLIVFGAVAIALVAAPLWVVKQHRVEQQKKIVAVDAAERAIDARAVAAAASAAAARAALPPDPDRLGLTYGWRPLSDRDRVSAACHGQPRVPRGALDACDAVRGDSSCRTVLAVLCIRTEGRDGPELATTATVAGFLLDSAAAADARCANELGPSWRMLTTGDGSAMSVLGRRAAQVRTHERAWVAADGARANCWDR